MDPPATVPSSTTEPTGASLSMGGPASPPCSSEASCHPPFAAACPHKAGPLWEGQVSVKRCEIVCPWHRFRFDLRSGKSVTYDKLVARTYPVAIRNGQVFLDS